jgi:Fe2+ or Zn2+ uptake regulation protein
MAAHDQQLANAIRSRGGRVTPQRIVIARALRRLHRHATVDEVTAAVARELPGVSVPTVYSTLELLAGLGLARRVTAAPGAVLYDPRTDDHHHLVCTRCRAVEDVDSEVDTGAVLAAAERQGFAPERAELVVSGLCRSCRQAADRHA